MLPVTREVHGITAYSEQFPLSLCRQFTTEVKRRTSSHSNTFSNAAPSTAESWFEAFDVWWNRRNVNTTDPPSVTPIGEILSCRRFSPASDVQSVVATHQSRGRASVERTTRSRSNDARRTPGDDGRATARGPHRAFVCRDLTYRRLEARCVRGALRRGTPVESPPARRRPRPPAFQC